jgi:hypothetical protein
MARLLLVVLIAGSSCVVWAESFQPASHVTRGIYADIRPALRTAVWRMSAGSTLVGDRPHSGPTCLRAEGGPGVQGANQRVVFNQREPRPVKIAGWSRAEGVRAAKDYRYSVYVDFVFTDGKPWHMKLACFAPGTHDWQYAENIVRPPKPLAHATVNVFLRESEGTAWFDDLFVGEVDGRNLLVCPGFERDGQLDLAERDKLFADLAALRCNAIHAYLSDTFSGWDAPLGPGSELLAFLRSAGARGIGTWLTVSMPPLPLRNADDPNFPQYDCVNGPWADRWQAALVKAARYPFAGLSMVPDEYNWNNGELQRAYGQHADAKVREFYARLGGAYCTCPECRRRYEARYHEPLPEPLPHVIPATDARYRHWLRFRYDSTTAWIARTAQAVKAVNPALRTDSLLCVSPICSDRWYPSGLAWERLGYEAGLEYPTTDPYILLHNYLGDSTHWYVTETTEHLAAAGPQRRCGVVLEACRLRREYRELDPVEIYGAALSAVWHGADELAWFHHSCILGPQPLAPHPEMNRAAIAGVYGLLAKMDPWLDGLRPQPGVALLFSRASCDAWRMYLQAAKTKPPFDTRGSTEPRLASQVQKEALYLLLRTGVPTTLYYLETVRKAELAPHRVIVVPFPLAIDAERAGLLAELAREGKRIVICGSDGPLDADAGPHARPALAGLLAQRGVGQQHIQFLPPEVLERQAACRQHEKRSFVARTSPGAIDPQAAHTLLAALGDPSLPLLADRLPDGDDVELCLATNRQGQRLLLAINWSNQTRTLGVRRRPEFDHAPAEAYRLATDGRWTPWSGRVSAAVQLAPQAALVVRW